MGDALPTVFLGVGRTVSSMAAGYHSCAVLNTGELKCARHQTNGLMAQT